MCSAQLRHTAETHVVSAAALPTVGFTSVLLVWGQNCICCCYTVTHICTSLFLLSHTYGSDKTSSLWRSKSQITPKQTSIRTHRQTAEQATTNPAGEKTSTVSQHTLTDAPPPCDQRTGDQLQMGKVREGRGEEKPFITPGSAANSPLTHGSRHLHLRALEEQLNKLGHSGQPRPHNWVWSSADVQPGLLLGWSSKETHTHTHLQSQATQQGRVRWDGQIKQGRWAAEKTRLHSHRWRWCGIQILWFKQNMNLY